MAGPDAKTISFKFTIDEMSANRTKSFVVDLTRQISVLAENANRASRAMGGIGRGGGMVVDRRTNLGTAKTMPGGMGGGVVGMVANIAGGSVNELRGITQATQQALQSASTGLSSFVNRTESDIRRLRRSVSDLNNATTVMSPGPGAGNVRNTMALGQTWYAPTGPAIPNAVTGPKGGNWGAFWGPGGFSGYVGQRAQAFGGAMGLPPGGAAMLGRFASRFAIAGGVALGAASVYEFGAKSFEDERAAQIDYTLNEPLRRQQRRAAVAAPFRAHAQAALAGDIPSQVALRRVLASPEIRKSLENVTLRKEAIMGEFDKVSLSGQAKVLFKKFKGFAGRTYGEALSAISGSDLPEADKRSAIQLAEDVAMRGLGPQQAAMIEQAQRAEMGQMSPLYQKAMNTAYGGAMSRTNLARMMGIKSSHFTTKMVVRDGVRMPSTEYRDRLTQIEADLLRRGWTPEQRAQGYQSILGIGRGYGRAIGPIEVVSAGIAGLRNAPEIVRMGGTLAGDVQSAGRFYRGVQSSIGRGGLDVAAGSELFQSLGARAMATGDFGGRGAGLSLMRAAASIVGGGVGTPLDVAGQQRRIGQVTMGFQEFGTFTRGTKAPLYSATALMGAIGAAGGYGAHAEMLTKISPEQMTDIVRGGPIPPALAGHFGNDSEARVAVKDYLKFQRRAPLFEVVDDLVTGRNKDLLAEVRAAEGRGGSFVDVVSARTQKLTGKARANAIGQITEQLGGILQSQGLAPTAQSGAGVFLSQLAQDQKIAPFLKGRGAHATGPGDTEKKALEDQAQILEKLAVAIGKLNITADKLFRGAEASDAGEAAVKMASRGQSADLGMATGDLIAALQSFQIVIKNQSRPVKATK